jgi:hypothetical protein
MLPFATSCLMDRTKRSGLHLHRDIDADSPALADLPHTDPHSRIVRYSDHTTVPSDNRTPHWDPTVRRNSGV